MRVEVCSVTVFCFFRKPDVPTCIFCALDDEMVRLLGRSQLARSQSLMRN